MKKIVEQAINIYGKGTVNSVDETLIDDGAASKSVNFLTRIDRIELIPGRRLIGAEEASNDGVLGLGKIMNVDGTETMFRKIGTKLQYFNNTTQLWVDSKTGLLADEPLYFSNSFTPAGRQVWACGQDGLFKIYPSAPTDVLDLTNSTKNYKGQISIERSRMICWDMKEDPTGLRFSKVDNDSNYTAVTAEAITDTATGKKHYTGTLSKGQGFGYAFKDGSAQTLTDDKNGNLIGDGTGTINYATGAYVLDFAANTGTAVVCDYLWEDPVNGGLADFTYTATRVAGEGNVLRQDSVGSRSMIVLNFNDTYYTLQDKGSWWVKISTDDLTWDNQVYRSNIGCPSPRAAVVTADGMIFVDTFDPKEPKLRLLAFNQLGDKIIPTSLSDNFKMEDYQYDEDTAMFKKGDWVLIFCKKDDSPNNNVLLIYNILQKSFDVCDYSGQMGIDFASEVLVGDSMSSNVYELFTGFDDLDYEIVAEWEGKKTNLKTDYLKKFKKFRLTGYIDIEQSFEIYMSFDNDPYILMGRIEGNGAYVDEEDAGLIGSEMIGEDVLGLIASSNPNYFETELKIHTPKFKRVKVKFVPLGIGYLSILEQKFSDIRIKSSKIPKKYKIGTGEGVGFSPIDDSFTVS